MKEENGSSTISKQQINEHLELEFRAAEDFYSASLTTINQDTPAKYFEAFFSQDCLKWLSWVIFAPLWWAFALHYNCVIFNTVNRDLQSRSMLPLLSSKYWQIVHSGECPLIPCPWVSWITWKGSNLREETLSKKWHKYTEEIIRKKHSFLLNILKWLRKNSCSENNCFLYFSSWQCALTVWDQSPRWMAQVQDYF